MDEQADHPDYDEYRPAKKMKLDSGLAVTENTREEMEDDEDGWDDIYGTAEGAANTEDAMIEADSSGTAAMAPTAEVATTTSDNATQSVPTSGSTSAAQQPAPSGTLQMAPAGESATTNQPESQINTAETDGIPAQSVGQGEDLVAETTAKVDGMDEPSSRMVAETSEVSRGPAELDMKATADMTAPGDDRKEAATDNSNDSGPTLLDALSGLVSRDDTSELATKPSEDPEFLAAAENQKGNAEAEWRFDASDAESSSDTSSDSSSDSDSDSDSEGGYEMLDAATAAKILMAGEGDDDEGGDKKRGNADNQPRTANEIKEDVVAKPEVIITDDMKITLLGKVENAVENMALIKAHTSGEYQVLESGSVLCTKDRKVLGAVGETFGRVQEPLYSITFSSAQELEDLNVRHGTEVYYVDNHSTFVFTQPLKNLKGTDASNIHDEEVGEDELEFSDDEREAEYKRAKKMAKKAGRGGLSRGAFNEGAGRTYGAPGNDSGPAYTGNSDQPSAGYGGGMNYDDDAGGQGEDFYSPLKRPDNLSDLMAGGAPPRPQQFDRGRGRGRGDRGRGRGDSGRGGRGGQGGGRGGFERKNQRGGNVASPGGSRGQHQPGAFKGNAQSFPDAHNSELRQTYTQPLPPKPTVVPAQAPQQAYPPHPSMYQQAPQQQTYQFNGYAFQYGAPPPQQSPPGAHQGGYGYPPHPSAAAQPAAPMPAPGGYVNPAFYQPQQTQQSGQWAHQQPPTAAPSYPAWPGAQNGQAPPQGQTGQQPHDLVEILRRLGQ